MLFNSNGYAYAQVCGRITGYQYASPDVGAHIAYTATPGNEINEPYVDGVSITYGPPRKHIWSFYGGWNPWRCCSQEHIDNTESLGFIGNNNFCDTGNLDNEPWGNALFSDHPLWDGIAHCANSATCCAPHAGPWFYTSITPRTVADIEVRICGDQSTLNEDTPLGLLEIYVK